MARVLAWILLAAAGGALWLSCGGDCRILLSGGVTVGCGDEPPGPGDPDFGDAAEVLVEDCADGNLLWVGIAAPITPTPGPPENPTPTPDAGVFGEFETLRCDGELNWIGGTVRPAEDLPNGFFFDPGAILVLETADVAVQTTIAAIASDPDFFAPGGDGGQAQWVVPADVLAIETLLPLMCAVAPVCGS